MRRVLLAVSLLLLFAPAAHAGGWATVGLDSTPTGKQWNVNLTVLQHGRTPLAGVKPQIEIRSGTETRFFDATPTTKKGVYHATVTFPRDGRWTYVVYDGFVANQAHGFPPVTIGQQAAPATTDGGPRWWLAAAGIALVLVAVLIVMPKRRAHQPQAA